MSIKEKNKGLYIFDRALGVLTAVSAFAAGACLVGACLGIYQGGKGEYTRTAVAEAFGAISVPVYIFPAIALVGLLYRLFIGDKSSKGQKTPVAYTLSRLALRADLSLTDGEVVTAVESERKRRRNLNVIFVTALSAVTVIYSLYALDGDRYTDDISTSVAKAAVGFLICYLPVAVIWLFRMILIRRSMEREITLLRKAPKRADGAQKTSFADTVTPWIRIALIAIGTVLLAVGIWMGGMADVLTKAINICTECVGLG